MHGSSRTPSIPRPAATLAGLVAGLALALAAAAPASLSAQSDLFILDTVSHSAGGSYTLARPPVVGRLSTTRFVTAQRFPGFLNRLELRSWEIEPNGDITLLHTLNDYSLGFQEVADITGLGTTRFATALKPSPTTVHLVTWQVSTTGIISKIHDHPGLAGAAGEVDLVTAISAQIFTYRVLGLYQDTSGAGTTVRQWHIDSSGQVTGTQVIDILDGSTDNAIATYGQGQVAVALRLTSGSMKLFHLTYVPSNNWLLHESSATGPAVIDVDVAYSGSGRIVTAAHRTTGQLEVAAWSELTLPPWNIKLLFTSSSALTPDAVSAISIAPLMNTKVVTAVINGVNRNELISWETGSTVALLDRLQDFNALSVSLTHVSWDDVVTATKATSPYAFWATAWTDLIPQ